MKKLLVTPEEAAEMLSVGRTRVFSWIGRGQLRSVVIGRSRRIPFDALRDFVATLEESVTDRRDDGAAFPPTDELVSDNVAGIAREEPVGP